MKKIIFWSVGILGVIIISNIIKARGWLDNKPTAQKQNTTQNNVSIIADTSNTSFDVSALAALVRKTTNPKLLEKQINDTAAGINNMDLDKDGKVDFLAVTETDTNVIHITDAAVNPPVIVAILAIDVDKEAKTANLLIEGNSDYCGINHDYYEPDISFGDMLLMAYLLRPHIYYSSPYGYGHYPVGYSSYRTIRRTSYRPSTSKFSGVLPSEIRSLNAPNSRRSFSTRSRDKKTGTGGFGRSHRSTYFGHSNHRHRSSHSSRGYRSSRSGYHSSGRSHSHFHFGRRRR